ncbi:MAG: molybdopterin-dependent oxidoreductase [Euryarchaeota archaeon]|nr:molybdopterin-dependent oxidoreductase [Euryarchaeota archaeon]
MSGASGTRPAGASHEDRPKDEDLVEQVEATRAEAGYRLIGKRVPLIDASLKVTGRAEYTDDLKRPGMLVGRLLKSIHPHANLRRVDADGARQLPGVAAVLTGERYPTPFGVLPMTHDETALAVDRVRFLGEHVAAVAAVDEETCERAFDKIKVDYEPLPVYDDPKVSKERVAVKIHARALRDTNLQKEVVQHFGDVPGAFAKAPFKVKVAGKYLGVTHAFTEPHCTIADSTPDGRLTVWSATQVPHYLHRALSEVLGIPMHRIRVVKPEVGGGFGGKSDPFPHEIACAALSIETGRPVKVLFDREDVFYLNHGRHPTLNEVSIAAQEDGTFLGMDLEALIDGGAWSSFGTVSTYYNGVLAMGPYKFDNFRYHGYRAYTNHPPSGAMRAHGGTNIRYSVETAVDELAEKLDFDPIDLRLKNFLPPNCKTVNEFRITSNSVRACILAAKRASGWEEKFRRLSFGKGIGVACGFYISGSNSPIHFSPVFPQCTVHLKADMDAGVTIHCGAADIGQGSKTLLAQIVAEVLGIRMDRCRVAAVDSDTAPIDIGSYSSRVTFMMGNAARAAAENLKAPIFAAASELLQLPVEDLEASEERVHLKGHPEKGVPFHEALHKAMEKKGALVASGAFSTKPMGGTFKGAKAGTAPAYSFSAYVAQVDVDVETGFIKVEKVWAAFDCGRPLNPLAVEGQIEGSIHMGLGQLLSEGLSYRGARLMNPSLLDYKILTPQQMPEVECLLVGEDDPEGPFGAKEAGEGPLVAALPAVGNALFDAIGCRFRDLPITPDKVLRALDEQGKKGGGGKPDIPHRRPPNLSN